MGLYKSEQEATFESVLILSRTSDKDLRNKLHVIRRVQSQVCDFVSSQLVQYINL